MDDIKDCKNCKHRACDLAVEPCKSCKGNLQDDTRTGFEPRVYSELIIGKDYLSCNVYRDACGDDCTNGGISATAKDLTLIAENVTLDRVKQYCTKYNRDINKCVQVYTRNLQGRNYVVVVPILLHEKNSTAWTMFGGNYIGGASDSRFKDITGNHECHPVPIHDRQEH